MAVAVDPFIAEVGRLAADLDRIARAQVAPGSNLYSVSFDMKPKGQGPEVRVRVWMVIEPFSEEHPVEEDEVTFTLAPDSVKDVAFRRFFLDKRTEERLDRSAEMEARLIADIRAFFCEAMGVSGRE